MEIRRRDRIERLPSALRRWLVPGVVLLGMGLASAAGRANDLVLSRAAAPMAARLVGWDEGPRFDVEGTISVVPPEDLIRWGAIPAERGGGWLLLTGGSRLAARVTTVGPEEVRFAARGLATGALPAERVVGWIEHPPRTGLAELEQRLRAVSGADDLVVAASGERIAGVLQVGEAASAAAAWRIERRGVSESVSRQRTRAVVLSPALRASGGGGPAVWQLGLADGSHLMVTHVTPDGRMTLSSGAEIAFSGPAWIDRIQMVAPAQAPGSLVSRDSPLRAVHQPFFPDGTSAELVASGGMPVGGESLQVAGRIYPFGLAMRSGMQVVYRVPASARGLWAELAIGDGPTNGEAKSVGGAAVFRVLAGADVGSIREVFRSEVIRCGAVPEPIAVPLVGMRLVILAVDYGPAGDIRDDAVWLDARWGESTNR